MNITWIGCNSNNYMKGRDGKKPEVVIIHWINGSLASCDSTFQNSDRKASAHYGIADNTVHQYVKEEDTSYNCGVWEWNLKSVSIEHEASPTKPMSENSYITSGRLVREICHRHNIPIDREHIKGHNEFKATQCPGTIDINKIIKLAKGDEENMGIDRNQIEKLFENMDRVAREISLGEIDEPAVQADKKYWVDKIFEGSQTAFGDWLKGIPKASNFKWVKKVDVASGQDCATYVAKLDKVKKIMKELLEEI